MSVLFSNLEQLLQINQLFYKWIDERIVDKTIDSIGDLFIQVV